MIRPATDGDIAAIVAMTERLRASVASPLPVDPLVTSRFLSGLLASPLGWVRVVDAGDGPTGFLAASIGTASVAMTPVAVEHGWWAEQGGGLRLLKQYVAWARERGCFAARMSTHSSADNAAKILGHIGFTPAEQAWVLVL